MVENIVTCRDTHWRHQINFSISATHGKGPGCVGERWGGGRWEGLGSV